MKAEREKHLGGDGRLNAERRLRLHLSYKYIRYMRWNRRAWVLYHAGWLPLWLVQRVDQWATRRFDEDSAAAGWSA